MNANKDDYPYKTISISYTAYSYTNEPETQIHHPFLHTMESTISDLLLNTSFPVTFL